MLDVDRPLLPFTRDPETDFNFKLIRLVKTLVRGHRASGFSVDETRALAMKSVKVVFRDEAKLVAAARAISEALDEPVQVRAGAKR